MVDAAKQHSYTSRIIQKQLDCKLIQLISYHLSSLKDQTQILCASSTCFSIHIIVVNKNNDLNVSVGLEKNNLFEWNICFEGPSDSLYEGGLFQAILSFPDNYPDMPPKMKFITEMWHPNIYPDGNVCISILHAPGVDEYNQQEKETERWRPVLTAEDIIISVISMLMDPNTESPANIDASVQFRDDRNAYKKKVRVLTRKSIGDL